MLLRSAKKPGRRQIVGLRIEIALALELVAAGQTDPAGELRRGLEIQRIDIAHIVTVVRHRRLRTRAGGAVLEHPVGVDALVAGLPTGARREGVSENDGGGVEAGGAAAVGVVPPGNERGARVIRRTAGVQNRDICRRERQRGDHARGREDGRRNTRGGGADIGLDEIVGSPEAAGNAQGGEHIVACEALSAGAAIGIVAIHALPDIEVQQTG